MVDFIGADRIAPGRDDSDAVFRTARPKLEEVQRLGCRRSSSALRTSSAGIRNCCLVLPAPPGWNSGPTPGLYGASDHKLRSAVRAHRNCRPIGTPLDRGSAGTLEAPLYQDRREPGPLDALDRSW